jgi:hypothetical protein
VPRYRPDLSNAFFMAAPAVFTALAGLCLVLYAGSAALWSHADSSRDIVLVLELPFFVLAIIDQRMRVRSPQGDLDTAKSRGPVIVVAGMSLLLALVFFSVSWSGLTRALGRSLTAATTYCVPESEVTEHGNELSNPYISSLALDIQTRTPMHVVTDPADCKLLHTGYLHTLDIGVEVSGGWFHIGTSGVASSGALNTPPGTGPVIFDFSPTSGPVGIAVIIDGDHLRSATKVTIDGVAARIVHAYEEKVRIIVPKGASTGYIVVSSSHGTAKSPTSFHVS